MGLGSNEWYFRPPKNLYGGAKCLWVTHSLELASCQRNDAYNFQASFTFLYALAQLVEAGRGFDSRWSY